MPDRHAYFTDPHVNQSGPRDNFGPIVVPPGKFFVLGDNRDRSYDSRFWGFANVGDIKGRRRSSTGRGTATRTGRASAASDT